MTETHQLRPARELVIEILEEDPSILIDFDVPNHRTCLLGDQSPRQQVRGMLGEGQENLIAPTKQRARLGGCDQIDSLGAASGPDDLVRLGSVEESGDALARALAEGRFKTTQMESDLRPGGTWLMRGIGVGGRPFTIQGVYREIQRPRLLVFTWLPSWQTDALESLVRFDLEEKSGTTTVRVTHSGLTTESARLQHGGWSDILGWLRAHSE